MIRIALTGSIAMGKSTVANIFAANSIPVYDSDEWTHKALTMGSSIFKSIVDVFPESWDKKSQKIDRVKLGQIIFSDSEKRNLLESLVHPYIWDTQDEFTKKHTRLGRNIILFDIPLLFETGSDTKFDKIVVVSAPAFLQKKRALARDGMTEEKFNAIRERQWPDDLKKARADYVVNTGLGRAFSTFKVKSILTDIRKDKNYA